jgi:3-mercaptopyruvate sulfurtransferase SseA
VIKDKNINLTKPLTVHCLTGMTATSLALALYLLGYKETAVYYVNIFFLN